VHHFHGLAQLLNAWTHASIISTSSRTVHGEVVTPASIAGVQRIWQYEHLKPKDAIHVASAISQQLDVLHSYDTDLLALDGQLGTPPLRICQPGEDDPPPPLALPLGA
jgi:predicted nucleic acid-binding protein